MPFILALFGLLPFVVTPHAVETAVYMDTNKSELLRHAQEAVLNDDFAALDSLHTTFQSIYPNDPAHYLIQVASEMAKMSYREEVVDGQSFIDLTEKMFHEATGRVDTADPSARSWYYLIAGHARLYRSLYEAHFGSKFLAMRHGFGAMEYYQKGFQCDSSNIDLLLGMGSFRYWKSVKAGILRTLGFIKNEKELGADELRNVAQHSLISSSSARSALVYVYLDMDSLAQAHDLACSLIREFPRGRSMRWALGDVLMKMDSTRAARDLYRSLRADLETRPDNYYNIISCDAAITKTLIADDSPNEASQHARVALASYPELSKEVKRRQSARLSRLRDLADNAYVTAVAVPFTR